MGPIPQLHTFASVWWPRSIPSLHLWPRPPVCGTHRQPQTNQPRCTYHAAGAIAIEQGSPVFGGGMVREEEWKAPPSAHTTARTRPGARPEHVRRGAGICSV